MEAENRYFTEIEQMISTAAATQAAAREREAAAAKAQAEAQNRPVISDDNGVTLKDLEKRLIKAKLTYPGAKEDTGGDNGDKSVSEAHDVLSNIQKKLDKDGPMF